MDARSFLGIDPLPVELSWRLEVTPEVSTPGKFLFGGCALGAALVAMEQASGRETVWATAQYLSFAETGTTLDLDVTLAATGHRITQARAVGRVSGREILTVNAALGEGGTDIEATWVEPPVVRPPEECPPRQIPEIFGESVLNRVDVRVAEGRMLEQVDGTPGTPRTAFWARLPGHLEPSAATLAIIGDYLASGVAHPIGKRVIGRSLDNTIRVAQIVPTEWILCDIRIHALARGVGQGLAHLWSEDGILLGTASQSLTARLWPGDPG